MAVGLRVAMGLRSLCSSERLGGWPLGVLGTPAGKALGEDFGRLLGGGSVV